MQNSKRFVTAVTFARKNELGLWLYDSGTGQNKMNPNSKHQGNDPPGEEEVKQTQVVVNECFQIYLSIKGLEQEKWNEVLTNRQNVSPRETLDFKYEIYDADMRSSLRKTLNETKLQPSEKWQPRGDPWAFGGRKIFLVEFFQTIYSVSIWGPHHEKPKIREKCNHRKNEPSGGGALGP